MTEKGGNGAEKADWSGKPASAELEGFKAESLGEPGIRLRWREVTGKANGAERPLWLLKLGLEYHYLALGQARVYGRASQKVARRLALIKAFDVAGLERESRFLVNYYDKNEARGGKMGVKKGKEEKRSGKERRAARITAGAVLVRLLGQEEVPDDLEIVRQVRAETGSEKFDGRQLSWYKWKYKQGMLRGQDGTAQVIRQGSPTKKAAAKPAVTKKKK